MTNFKAKFSFTKKEEYNMILVSLHFFKALETGFINS